jgi:hypothetical protein
VDEVRKIMREGGLSFLVVLDHNVRMVAFSGLRFLEEEEEPLCGSQNKKAARSPKRIKLPGNHMGYTGVTIAP